MAAKLTPGQMFCDRFTLQKLLSATPKAELWRAVDNESGKKIALKIYTSENEDFAAMRDTEEALAGVKHPNILTAFHFSDRGEMPFILMRYFKNRGLDRVAGELDEASLVEAFAQVAEGLDGLHKSGLAHGNLKPSNILSKGTEEPVFLLADIAQRSAQGELFAAPEKIVSAAADVYSLGLSLYAAAGGSVIASGERDLYQITSPLLREVIEACLVPDPGSRPSAESIAKRLKGEIPSLTPTEPEHEAPIPSESEMPLSPEPLAAETSEVVEQEPGPALPTPAVPEPVKRHTPNRIESDPLEETEEIFEPEREKAKNGFKHIIIGISVLLIILAAGYGIFRACSSEGVRNDYEEEFIPDDSYLNRTTEEVEAIDKEMVREVIEEKSSATMDDQTSRQADNERSAVTKQQPGQYESEPAPSPKTSEAVSETPNQSKTRPSEAYISELHTVYSRVPAILSILNTVERTGNVSPTNRAQLKDFVNRSKYLKSAPDASGLSSAQRADLDRISEIADKVAGTL